MRYSVLVVMPNHGCSRLLDRLFGVTGRVTFIGHREHRQVVVAISKTDYAFSPQFVL
jgi:hypothetical protein